MRQPTVDYLRGGRVIIREEFGWGVGYPWWGKRGGGPGFDNGIAIRKGMI